MGQQATRQKVMLSTDTDEDRQFEIDSMTVFSVLHQNSTTGKQAEADTADICS